MENALWKPLMYIIWWLGLQSFCLLTAFWLPSDCLLTAFRCIQCGLLALYKCMYFCCWFTDVFDKALCKGMTGWDNFWRRVLMSFLRDISSISFHSLSWEIHFCIYLVNIPTGSKCWYYHHQGQNIHPRKYIILMSLFKTIGVLTRNDYFWPLRLWRLLKVKH